MSKDMIIKKQALSYLAKDNWGTAILGFFVLCLPTILILLFLGLLSALLISSDLNAENAYASVCLDVAGIVLFIIFTPIFTGYLRLCYNISNGNNPGISDIFYYFKNGLYTKCLAINIRIIAMTLFHFLLLMIPVFLLAGIYFSTKLTFIYYFDIALIVASAVETLFYSTKYSAVPCVLFEDENLTSKEIFNYGTGFMREKRKDTNKLLLTFFPYFLLCFFVIPWIFVFPYFSVSFMTNGKWITQLYIRQNNNEVY